MLRFALALRLLTAGCSLVPGHSHVFNYKLSYIITEQTEMKTAWG